VAVVANRLQRVQLRSRRQVQVQPARRKLSILILEHVAHEQRASVGLQLRPEQHVLAVSGRVPELVGLEFIARVEVVLLEDGLGHWDAGASVLLALDVVQVGDEFGEEVRTVGLGVHVVVGVVEVGGEWRVAADV